VAALALGVTESGLLFSRSSSSVSQLCLIAIAADLSLHL
jgi:hypothetical protein